LALFPRLRSADPARLIFLINASRGIAFLQTRGHADAVILLPSPMLYGEHKHIVELAAESQVDNCSEIGTDVRRGDVRAFLFTP
jgi:hypothetical protein